MQQFLFDESQNIRYTFSNLITQNQKKNPFKLMIPYKKKLDYPLTIALLKDLRHQILLLETPQFPIKVEFFLQITQKFIFIFLFTSSKVQDLQCQLQLNTLLDIIRKFKKDINLQNENAKNSQNFSLEQIKNNPLSNLNIQDFYFINSRVKYSNLIEDYLKTHSLDAISEKIMRQEYDNDGKQQLSKLFMLDDSTDYFSFELNFEQIKKEYSEQVNKFEKAQKQNQNKDSQTILKMCFDEKYNAAKKNNKKKRQKKEPQTADQPKTKPNIHNQIQQKQPKINKLNTAQQQQQQQENSNQKTNKRKQNNNLELFENDIMLLKSQFDTLLSKVQTQQLQLKQQQQQQQQKQKQEQEQQQQEKQQFFPLYLNTNNSTNSKLFQIQNLNENEHDGQQFSDILLYSWIYSQLKSLYLQKNYNLNSLKKSETEIYKEMSQLFQLTYQNSNSQEKMALETYLTQWKDILANDFHIFVKSCIPKQQSQNIENNTSNNSNTN